MKINGNDVDLDKDFAKDLTGIRGQEDVDTLEDIKGNLIIEGILMDDPKVFKDYATAVLRLKNLDSQAAERGAKRLMQVVTELASSLPTEDEGRSARQNAIYEKAVELGSAVKDSRILVDFINAQFGGGPITSMTNEQMAYIRGIIDHNYFMSEQEAARVKFVSKVVNDDEILAAAEPFEEKVEAELLDKAYKAPGHKGNHVSASKAFNAEEPAKVPFGQ
ncbi:MAG: hypothetical protein LBN07_04340 [Christensenellaceae bacterium]|jgi:hypothetical protein|nr:hypothetical protein [Christensenellaceae bacterium]